MARIAFHITLREGMRKVMATTEIDAEWGEDLDVDRPLADKDGLVWMDEV